MRTLFFFSLTLNYEMKLSFTLGSENVRLSQLYSGCVVHFNSTVVRVTMGWVLVGFGALIWVTHGFVFMRIRFCHDLKNEWF